MTTTVIVNVGTLDEASTAFLNRLLTSTTESVPVAPALPTAPTTQTGEQYAGIAFVDGKPSHHLFLLDAKSGSRLQWQDAKDWAESVGGELPERFEAALLYANLRDQFDTSNWHWTATQFSAGSAWIQHFTGGNQSNDGEDLEFLARAVRRLPL